MPPKRKKAQTAEKKNLVDPPQSPVLKKRKKSAAESSTGSVIKKVIPDGYDAQLILNEGEKPKRGSFEIFVSKNDGEKVQIWSGLAKGPPRKLKFPDYEADLKDQFQKIINE